jgi:hypothetical protein
MSNLNLATTGKYLTPRERAKMVIALQLRILSETTPEEREKQQQSSFGLLLSSEDREIKELVNSCPPHQGKDYNFYIDLKQYVWEHIVDEIRTHLLTIQIMSGNIAPLLYLMTLAPFLSEGIEQLHRLPVVVEKDSYDKAVVQERERERGEVLLLDGPYDLVKQEAYYRLVAEKKIDEGDFEAYRDYMDNFGKSKEVLIQEKVASIRKSIDWYEKRKQRTGGESPMSDYVPQYFGQTDEEIADSFDKDFDKTFYIPTKEEFKLWESTVKVERQRIQTAINQGILVKKGVGVEAGSYYDWKERHQKFAGEDGAEKRGWNPLDESCMEIGFSDGKVVSSAFAKEGDWHQIIAVSVHNKESMGYAGDSFGSKRLKQIIEFFTMLTPITQSEKRFDKEERIITIQLDEHRKLLTEFAINIQKEIQAMVNKIALIKAIEDAYFDGMPVVISGKSSWGITLSGMREIMVALVTEHNDKVRGVTMDYNRLCHGLWDYRLTDMESYILNPEPHVDEQWVEAELERVRQKLRSG